MTDITRLCRGQPCYIRLPGICGDPETVVPAHPRLVGISGMGHKAPDFMACPACMNCHDAVDRRRYMHMDRDFVQKAHYEAILRWQYELYEREVIAVHA
jgi:hypothetical protein